MFDIFNNTNFLSKYTCILNGSIFADSFSTTSINSLHFRSSICTTTTTEGKSRPQYVSLSELKYYAE